MESVLVWVSLSAAWYLQFDFSLPNKATLAKACVLLVILRLLAMAQFNLLHGWWRYVGISDIFDISKSVIVGSAAFMLLIRYVVKVPGIPVLVYLIEGAFTFVLLAGIRICSRILAESFAENAGRSKRVAIIGGGFAAQMIIREINQDASGYSVAACFDDDKSKRGVRLNGVPVVGTVDELPKFCERKHVDELLIAVPSATGAQMRRFVDICEATGVRFKTIPALRELIDGTATLTQVREVAVEDLLGREPIAIDLESVRTYIEGRVVMVTGAAGSIGSELSRQILSYGPSCLLCVDQDETGIFELECELANRGPRKQVVCAVANVGNEPRIRSLCMKFGVKTIFHAAAYKHVPIMESNVQEAVTNNVIALVRLLGVAEATGCESFVLISSDKAVNPTNVMGITKRICELIVSSWPTERVRCVSVRFGNVLGSNGSVVPIFQRQISEGKPITITHPDIERYFMTIPEAVALVLQAFVIGKHRDVLVLDMGRPVRIVDLANTLIRLSGKSPDAVPIQFTGLRDGEKMFEELFYEYEDVQPTQCEKIKRTSTPVVQWNELLCKIQALQESLYVDGADPVRRALEQLLPDHGKECVVVDRSAAKVARTTTAAPRSMA